MQGLWLISAGARSMHDLLLRLANKSWTLFLIYAECRILGVIGWTRQVGILDKVLSSDPFRVAEARSTARLLHL